MRPTKPWRRSPALGGLQWRPKQTRGSSDRREAAAQHAGDLKQRHSSRWRLTTVGYNHGGGDSAQGDPSRGGRWRSDFLKASRGGSASQVGDAVSHNSDGVDPAGAIRKPAVVICKPAGGSMSRLEVRAIAVKASGGSRYGQRVRPRQRQQLEATESGDLARGGSARMGDLRTLVETTRTRRDLKLWPKRNRWVAARNRTTAVPVSEAWPVDQTES